MSVRGAGPPNGGTGSHNSYQHDGGAADTSTSTSTIDDAATIPPHLTAVFDDVEDYYRFRRVQDWLRRRRPFRDLEQVELGDQINYLDSPIGVVDAGGLRVTSLREWRRCA